MSLDQHIPALRFGPVGVALNFKRVAVMPVFGIGLNSKPADYAVGDAWGGSVIYPCYSLVDHTDGEPVECHPDSALRTERRRAWRLA
ncbi:hypothetical protein K4X57_03280 [Enterobacter hormaechei]|nr:hypothetical protein [Enterobacter hormaechei]